jgi:hypothetical protein
MLGRVGQSLFVAAAQPVPTRGIARIPVNVKSVLRFSPKQYFISLSGCDHCKNASSAAAVEIRELGASAFWLIR